MKEKKMRVWWMPQLGANCIFYIPVKSVEEAKKFLDVLAAYDQFQYQNRIKPDFCNSGGLQVWDEVEQDWIDWSDEDGIYDDVDEYIEETSNNKELAEFTKEIFDQVNFEN